ncbi:hypothetical protein JCM10213_001295 [Rhodosporidiobolus nylandii]
MPSFLFAVGASRLSTFTHLRAPTMVSCPSFEDYEEYFSLLRARWFEENQVLEADSHACELSSSSLVLRETTSTRDLATEQAAFAPSTSATPLVLTGLYRDAFHALQAACAHAAAAFLGKRFSPSTGSLPGLQGLPALYPRAFSGVSLLRLPTPATVKLALACSTSAVRQPLDVPSSPGQAPRARPAAAQLTPPPFSHPRPRASRMRTPRPSGRWAPRSRYAYLAFGAARLSSSRRLGGGKAWARMSSATLTSRAAVYLSCLCLKAGRLAASA